MTTGAAAVPAALRRATQWLDRLHARVVALQPLYVLSGLIAVQWAAVAALAVVVRHNGWLYYQGGDQLWHYTSAYLLSHGDLGPTLVGYGWATLLAPIARFAGPDLVAALPAIVLLNVVVLLPIALLCVYGIAARLGGRLFGYWTTLIWVVAPFATIPYLLSGYHQKYTELTLPQILGLSAMSDLPSVVALLVGAYLCVRALDERDRRWSAAAGFAVGCSLAIKPSNAAFLFAPAALFLIFRRPALLTFAFGLLPPAAMLGFWKFRGFGTLPAFAHADAEQRRVAAGVFSPLHKYTGDNSWTQLHNNLLQLREFFWSDRLLEFAAIAGMVALFLRTRRGGVFVTTWFLGFLLLKGTYYNSSVEDATFWRLMLPAFPAYVLLVAAIPLLFPGVRLRPPSPRALAVARLRLVAAVAGAVIFVLFPLALVAAANPIHQQRPRALEINATLVPVSHELTAAVTNEPNGVLLEWQTHSPQPADVFYRVLRTKVGPSGVECDPTGACTLAPTDTSCREHIHTPDRCTSLPSVQPVGATRHGAWLDRPPPGSWIYRIGLAANWVNDPSQGDIYVLGPPVQISVR